MPQSNLTIRDVHVGDRVRFIDVEDNETLFGVEGTITGYRDSNTVHIRFDNGDSRTYFPRRLEIVESTAVSEPVSIKQNKTTTNINGKRIPIHLYVDRIGIELEGGWTSRPTINGDLHSDGSVYVSGMGYIGEAVSLPLKHKEVKPWLVASYPHGVNNSCGLHVHLSFIHTLYYQRLCERKFYTYFLNEMTAWGEKNRAMLNEEFYKRLAGRNSYCKNKFYMKEQIKTTGKDSSRYCHLNYCLNLHNTIEIRLLPMFGDVETAYMAINKVIDVFIQYLAKCKREKSFEENVETQQPEVTEVKEVQTQIISKGDFIKCA